MPKGYLVANIRVEFESIDTARTFYLSDEYQAAKAVRDACSETDLMIIEGAE